MGARELRENVNVAGLLEKNFNWITEHIREGRYIMGPGLQNSEGSLEGFKVLDYGFFDRGEAGKCCKAMIVQDPSGNIYFHFNGTGDGNWEYNAVAYGPQGGKTTSDVQDWAVNFFDSYLERHSGEITGDVFVSGHSQGGNNAQFVTIRSKYGEYITNCISLDGPGFSSRSLEEARYLYGEAYYDKQRDKVYAFNGEFDYVSCLGQEQLVPEDHVLYLSYDYDYRDLDVGLFHGSDGLFDENGELGEFKDCCSDFREFVLVFNEKIKNLPEEQQRDVALTVMKICENHIGGEKEPLTSDLSQEELDLLKEALVPVLVEVAEENPDLISHVMEELRLDPAVAEVVNAVIEELNEFPPEYRTQAFSTLLAGLVVLDNGKISFDKEKLDFWPAISAAVPLILETALHHPEELWNVISTLGADKLIMNYIAEKPAGALAIIVVAAAALPLITDLASAIVIIDAVIHFVEAAAEIANEIKKFILNSLQALKKNIEAVRAWLRQNFNPGVRYAKENPYFRADTMKMRGYAQRILRVNQRLKDLDQDLDHLYWQVGFLDLWNIIAANLLTGQSYALSRVASYLNTSADRLDEAEAKALRYMTGG